MPRAWPRGNGPHSNAEAPGVIPEGRAIFILCYNHSFYSVREASYLECSKAEHSISKVRETRTCIKGDPRGSR